MSQMNFDKTCIFYIFCFKTVGRLTNIKHKFIDFISFFLLFLYTIQACHAIKQHHRFLKQNCVHQMISIKKNDLASDIFCKNVYLLGSMCLCYCSSLFRRRRKTLMRCALENEWKIKQNLIELIIMHVALPVCQSLSLWAKNALWKREYI